MSLDDELPLLVRCAETTGLPYGRLHACGRPQHGAATPHVCGVCGYRWGGEQ